MSNEIKLLRAFIEASGFTVEELDAVPCKAQPSTGEILYESAYKVTKKQQGLADNILNIPNSGRLTKECIDDLLNPSKTVGGVIILRYEDEKT